MKTTPKTWLDTSSGTETVHNAQRNIVYRTRGHGEGFITRLMSPSDLGQYLKPFVFLDIFSVDENMIRAMKSGGGMPIHPHSGIATVTVFTEDFVRFDDAEAGTGEIAYGGVEWMRAGRGVWHGKEMSPGSESYIQGFQLWLALPPELENGEPESRYIEARDMRRAGPAYVIIGNYEDAQSPVPAPPGINYLLVTLKPGERWTYTPPKGHSIGWLALAKGALDAGETIPAGRWCCLKINRRRSQCYRLAKRMRYLFLVRPSLIRTRCIWAAIPFIPQRKPWPEGSVTSPN